MAPLILTSGEKGRLLQVDVDPTVTTLLDLRYQLFSLTDIPPERLVLLVAGSRIIPDDDADATRTLTDAGIRPGTVLRYEDAHHVPTLPPPQVDQSQSVTSDKPVTSGKPAVDLSDLQAALRSCSTLAAPAAGSAAVPAPAAPPAPAAAPALAAPPASASAPSSMQRAPVRGDTTAFVALVRGYREAVLEYEDAGLQEKARKVTPLAELKRKAAERRASNAAYATHERALAKELLVWFKGSFFTWMNAPECWACGQETNMVEVEPPSEVEHKHRASRVERYDCGGCGATTRFPRYNDAAKLLETRRGRCGEWAQAFTLIARAAGLRVRAVHDWTDHVWTEIYCSDREGEVGRWVHADSCEDVLDEPLLYEKGWGKKLNYCIATGADSVMDVTRRYTQDFDALRPRRTSADEDALQSALKEMNTNAVAALPAEEREAAIMRYKKDADDIGVPASSVADLPGRQSGSAAWVQSRGEDGASK